MFQSHRFLKTLLLGLLIAQPASSDVPKVATDILPVHSLVSQVMQDLGTPHLILDPGSDPHNHAMRPSQAATLDQAQIVIVIGTALTPWLEQPLRTLAGDAEIVVLLDVEDTRLLPYRDDDGHGHDGDTDPHAWLDPENAHLWLTTIAETLSKYDPSNANAYRANAEAAQNSLSELQTEFNATLGDIGPYGVHHDAFQYFETRFGLTLTFVIKTDDAHQPGAAQIAQLRADVRENDIACVFAEPLINLGIVETVLEGSDAKIIELDPIGTRIPAGPAHYSQVLRDIVQAMRRCH